MLLSQCSKSSVPLQFPSLLAFALAMEPDQAPSQPCGETSTLAAPAKLKIAGAWSGVLEVRLGEWTVPMLRAEVSRRSNGCHPPECINLISAGKILRDRVDGACPTLQQLGLMDNAKILTSAVSPAASNHVKVLEAKAASDAERSQHLARIKAAAEKLAARHAASSLPVEDFNIELEDQSGQKVKLGSETDQRGVMMGLMLHANAKRLIKEQKYKDALDVLAMGEEAFSLCDPKVIEMIDNVSILEIDTVWCYFMLRDISWLSMAGIRLAKARKGFERSHGKDSTRFRLLQAGRHTELAIYLRLELLEGVVAYHCGQFEQSGKALTAAQAKYSQLQVPDEALSLLMGMGYKEQAAKRALRMTSQDVQSAVDFLVEERAKKFRRRQEDIKRRDEIMQQKSYGMTPQRKAVNLQRLDELVSIGYEKRLAAEALRVNENDFQKALDDLTNPDTNSKLQLSIVKRRQLKEEAQSCPPVELENHLSIDRTQESGPSGGAVNDDKTEERDAEMEEEIANELTGDPLTDYDIEVSREGEAIAEYLALLQSTADGVSGPH